MERIDSNQIDTLNKFSFGIKISTNSAKTKHQKGVATISEKPCTSSKTDANDEICENTC